MDSLYDALNANEPDLLIDAVKKGLRLGWSARLVRALMSRPHMTSASV